MARLKWLDSQCGVDKEAEHEEKKQRLHHGTLSCQEYRDEGDYDLSRVHHDLPVVRALAETFIEEAVLLLGLELMKREAISLEKPEGNCRNPKSPEN